MNNQRDSKPFPACRAIVNRIDESISEGERTKACLSRFPRRLQSSRLTMPPRFRNLHLCSSETLQYSAYVLKNHRSKGLNRESHAHPCYCLQATSGRWPWAPMSRKLQDPSSVLRGFPRHFPRGRADPGKMAPWEAHPPFRPLPSRN